jgi:hypothetical protein
MDRKLTWIKEAFSRDVHIMQDGQAVGAMRRDILSNDVDASLNGIHLRFDVTGFLFHSVNIHDLNADNQIVGHIEFRFGKQAELTLTSGESYLWKRHNVLMREWDMIREDPNGLPEKEIVSYDLTRKFFEDAGDITVRGDGEPMNVEIIILTGLFIRNYFQRRRRVVAAAS